MINKKLQEIFKNIDTKIFSQIDTLKKKPEYLNAQEVINRVDDDVKEYLKFAGAALFFIVPLLIVFSLWTVNLGLREEIQERKQFIEVANKILANKIYLKESGQSIVSTFSVSTPSDFTTRVTQILNSNGINTERIKVSNVITDTMPGNVTKSEGNFNFDDLSISEVTQIFNLLVIREKMKISSINLKRKPTSELLKGNFNLVHYSKLNTGSL